MLFKSWQNGAYLQGLPGRDSHPPGRAQCPAPGGALSGPFSFLLQTPDSTTAVVPTAVGIARVSCACASGTMDHGPLIRWAVLLATSSAETGLVPCGHPSAGSSSAWTRCGRIRLSSNRSSRSSHTIFRRGNNLHTPGCHHVPRSSGCWMVIVTMSQDPFYRPESGAPI